jgi:CRP-like cAMP-binding protein
MSCDVPPHASVESNSMLKQASALAPVARALAARGSLRAADRDAILDLPHSVRTLSAGAYVVREGEKPGRCWALLQGFAYRHKIVLNGARQIVGIHLPGELLDLHNSMLEVADENVQALTSATVASIPVDALKALMESRPAVATAILAETLVDASIFREWMANIGRRDSRARMAHLLCELALRQQAAGIGEPLSYELPMTQEQLADTLGLTPVHVNRTLKALEAESLIRRDRRQLTIEDWSGLVRLGDFSPAYLCLDKKAAEPARISA